MNSKTIFRIVLNSGLGLILVVLWLQFVNLKEIVSILKTADLRWIGLFILSYLGSTSFRSLRFKTLLPESKGLFKDFIMLNLMSSFLSFIIPIRAGEISKAVYVSTQFNYPFSKSILWVFIDRFFDFWVMVVIACILLWLNIGQFPQSIRTAAFLGAAGFTTGACLAIFAQKPTRIIITLGSKLLIIPKLSRMTRSLAFNILDGFTVLHQPILKWLVFIGGTFVATGFDALMWFSSLSAIGVNLGIIKTYLGTQLSSLTFLIPAAPGYVGSAEASGLVVLSLGLGVETNLASAVVVLNHILTLLIVPILGITSLYFLKFNLHLVWSKLRNKD